MPMYVCAREAGREKQVAEELTVCEGDGNTPEKDMQDMWHQ